MLYIENNQIPEDIQGAFLKGRHCEDHIFTLKGICSIRKSKKQKTHLAFLDLSKAFDSVERELLFISTAMEKGNTCRVKHGAW